MIRLVRFFVLFHYGLAILRGIILMNRLMSVDEQRNVMLCMLDEIKRFCLDKDITWSLAYGSLLGAVRHEGFIPWDDDVDIWMERNDYERFLEEYKSDRYSILNYRNGEAVCSFSKIVDNTTYLFEDGVNVSQPKMGVFVDIFPLDVVETTTGKHIDSKRFSYTTILMNSKFKKLGYCNSLSRNLILPVLKLIALPFNYRKTLEKMEKRASALCNEIPASVSLLLDLDSVIIPYKYISEVKMICFEGHEYPAYWAIDEILTLLYGDYMQLPPEDKRVTHRITSYFRNLE